MDRKFLIILIIAFIIIHANNVLALGITPARTPLDFSPGKEEKVTFSILNSEHKDMQLVIYAQGELNGSILLEQNSLAMSASEESRQLSYTVKMPYEMSPGQHITEIVVLALPGKAQNSQAYVGSTVAVVTQLYITVPYPGKYAEADMNIIDAEQNEEAVFVIPVISRGNMDLASVRANIDIYNSMNQRVSTINTDEITIKSGEKKDIVARWKAEVPVGIYRAFATVIYDEKTLKLERQFSVGSQTLELQEISVRNFRLGEVAKMEMLVENKWSEPIIGAYAQTNIFDKDGKVISDFKSPSYDIEPMSKAVMVSYWDSAGFKTGKYDASVFLRYGSKSSQKDFKMNVENDRVTIVGLGYVISEKKSSGGNSGIVTLLIVIIVVLILLNLTWFFILRKKLMKR